jgi:hypothetical protein
LSRGKQSQKEKAKSQTKTSLKMHKAAKERAEKRGASEEEEGKANANKHHDEAIHLSNKKFIKSERRVENAPVAVFLIFPLTKTDPFHRIDISLKLK